MFVGNANAHLVTRPKDKTVAARIASQSHNLSHAKYVCNNGRNYNRRWHCAATRWLQRELNESYAARQRSQTPTGGVWDRLAECESDGNWYINTGNGFYGGLQFMLSTWHAVGGSGYPHQNSKAEQIRRAQIAASRWGFRSQWPACSRKLGLR